MERHLAHWLAQRAGAPGAIVFAPPQTTASLIHFGGLRGLGTYGADNDEGLRATVTLASVSTLPEAQVLLQAREVRYLVLPSWDTFFDDYARWFLVAAQAARKSTLIPELRALNLPPWLRPLPYQSVQIGGLEGQSVLVLEVVDEQSPAVAMGRLAEYFVETGNLDRAAATAEALKRFPGDVGALAARAQVAAARGDAAALQQAVEGIEARLAAGGDRYLAWDRRVSLAVVLALGGRDALARQQAQRCLAEATAPRLRGLSTGSLRNLLVLTRACSLRLPDRELEALALELLPADLRDGLR